MAFDGLTIASLKHEFCARLLGGRIYKVYQPEADELLLIIKNRLGDENITERLVLSASAGLPLAYLFEESRENPTNAPGFCMLLRKHIGNGRIVRIDQPGFERILEFEIEHLDEMGDLKRKRLIVELMGKHSNIIFVDDKNMIIDSIKHISHMVSSVREVLPGREYVYPPGQDKKNITELDENWFVNHILTEPVSVSKAIYTKLTGISPILAQELCFRAGVDGDASTASLSAGEKEAILRQVKALSSDIGSERFKPCIAYDGFTPLEFAAVPLTLYGEELTGPQEKEKKGYYAQGSMSETVYRYYRTKNVSSRMKQHSTDLRKLVANAVERTAKKLDLQRNQLKSTEKREKYKIYGELLTAFSYSAKPGASEITVENYYDENKPLTIPLDKDLTAMENANRFFARYNKLKRTYEATISLVEESREELDYLLSVQNSLELAETLTDIADIKRELTESGYIRAKGAKQKKQEKSKPLHYISSDGYHMYVGKNNFQNDELSFRFAVPGDLWFHAKQMPGSHVIVKTNGDEEIPDSTYEEAARLAAFYSSGKTAPKVDVDYTDKKQLKKPPGAKPGYVIYHTNYSMTIEPEIHGIQEVK